jgi:excisionase family DNA binding protein
MSPNSTPWYTPARAAEYVGVTTLTLRRWAKAGALPAFYVNGGRNVRYRKTDLDQLMKVGSR